jgi:hypothetical protein
LSFTGLSGSPAMGIPPRRGFPLARLGLAAAEVVKPGAGAVHPR